MGYATLLEFSFSSFRSAIWAFRALEFSESLYIFLLRFSWLFNLETVTHFASCYSRQVQSVTVAVPWRFAVQRLDIRTDWGWARDELAISDQNKASELQVFF